MHKSNAYMPSDTELEFQYVRSSGPGGQNVNKVSSKVVMLWDFMESGGLSGAQKQRFAQKYGNKINKKGQFVISCDQFRDRGMNLSACKQKLLQFIDDIWRAPKIRRATKPSKAAMEKRLNDKKKLSEKKRQRRLTM